MYVAKIAIEDEITSLQHYRLARECDKLDIHFEQQLADEGLSKDQESWSDF